ncbi:MAG TPA: iron ABC transporter permease, partial [Propionibacteriaceae bacterium]
AALCLALVSAAVLILIPLAVLIRTSWMEGRDRLANIVSSPGFGLAVAHSFELSAAATLLAVPVGVAIALALRDPQLPGRAFWRVAVLLPLLIPDFVLGYSWLMAYARAGLTSELFGLTWASIQGPVGVSVIVAINAVPLVYLIITVGLVTRAEPTTERAARVSGAGPATVLRTITLPLLAPAIATAAVLVFVLSMGAFAIPQVVGAPAGFGTMTTRIYTALAMGSNPQGFVEAVTLAVLLVVVTLIVVASAERLLGERLQLGRTAARDTDWPSSRRTTRVTVTMAMALYLTITSGLPLLALLSAAVTRAIGVPSTPDNWTMDNFLAVLTPRTGYALGRSLFLALAAASVLMVLGSLTAALGRTRGGRSLSVLIMLTLVLPGSTLAIGLLIGYGRWLADTVVIILIAYLAKLWALAHRPMSAAVDRLPLASLQAARVSGAGLPTALLTVVVPLLRPALLAAWGLCFLTALHEVTMSSLLYGPGSETLAVVVLNSAELGNVGATAALSVLVTAIVVLPGAVLWVLSRPHAQRHSAHRARSA